MPLFRKIPNIHFGPLKISRLAEHEQLTALFMDMFYHILKKVYLKLKGPSIFLSDSGCFHFKQTFYP